ASRSPRRTLSISSGVSSPARPGLTTNVTETPARFARRTPWTAPSEPAPRTATFISAVREAEIVIADPEDVALGDLLPRDPLTVVLDAVRRAHVDHEVDAVLVLDHRVLARHVRVLERQVARLLAAAD